jgi:cell division protein FtsB
MRRATPAGRRSRGSPARSDAVTTGSGRLRPRLTHRAAVLGLVLLVLVISYASSLRAWLDQREQIAETRAEIVATRASIADLERERRRWADDAYVEQRARERLAFVMPGEVGYRVLGPDGESLGEVREPTSVAAEDGPSWYSTLWASSKRAGRER